MKHSGKCPKCEGEEIVHAPGGMMEGQSSVHFGSSFFPTIVRISHYLCQNCGFTELWVDGHDDLRKLRKMEPMVHRVTEER